jgi:hypothetical protein
MPGTAHRRGAGRDPARALGASRPPTRCPGEVPGSLVSTLRGGAVVVPRGVPAHSRGRRPDLAGHAMPHEPLLECRRVAQPLCAPGNPRATVRQEGQGARQ